MRVFAPFLLSAVFVVGLGLAAPVAAQDKGPLSDKDAAQKFMEDENPSLKKLNARSKELAETLGEAELKNLFYIRETFGALRAVAVVRQDIGAAVKACGKANPDMKDEMDARFKSWEDSVLPVGEEREAMMNAAIDAQTYMKAKDVRAYLKLIQKTAEFADKSIDKQYATSKEDCQSLLKSMGKTRDVIGELLSDLKIPAYDPNDKSFDGVPRNYNQND